MKLFHAVSLKAGVDAAVFAGGAVSENCAGDVEGDGGCAGADGGG